MRHTEPWERPLEIRLMDLITRVLVGVVFGSVCVVGVYVFLSQPRFNITGVEIENAHELKRVEILELEEETLRRLKGNFFTLSLDEVKSMMEEMPWVKKATVQRVWPSQLNVYIEEYEPVAYFEVVGQEGEEQVQLLDVEGDIFSVSEGNSEVLSLPRLRGLMDKSTAQQMWSFYQQLSLEFETLNKKIAVLMLSEHGLWSVDLDDGTKIIIGREKLEKLLKRVHAFVKTVPTALRPYEGRELIKADLRYPNGYAMEIDGVQTGVSASGRPVH